MQKKIARHLKKEEIILLSISPSLQWKEVHKKELRLIKGRFESIRSKSSIRSVLIRGRRFNAFFYFLIFCKFINRFFMKVEAVEMIMAISGVFVIYKLKEKSECFLGEIEGPLSKDFLKFLGIYHAFFKAGDVGVFSSEVFMEEIRRLFKEPDIFLKFENKKAAFNPTLPFYRFFGFDEYQCLYQDRYSDGSVGNISCSLNREAVSDYRTHKKRKECPVIHSLLDWLTFYMEETQ